MRPSLRRWWEAFKRFRTRREAISPMPPHMWYPEDYTFGERIGIPPGKA